MSTAAGAGLQPNLEVMILLGHTCRADYTQVVRLWGFIEAAWNAAHKRVCWWIKESQRDTSAETENGFGYEHIELICFHLI